MSCSRESAQKLVDLLRKTNAAHIAHALNSLPLRGCSTRSKSQFSQEMIDFIQSQGSDVNRKDLKKACKERFGIEPSISAIHYHRRGIRKDMRINKVTPSIREFINESHGLHPTEICSVVALKWATDIKPATVYKVWREQ